MIKDAKRGVRRLVDLRELRWCEAQGDYVVLHTVDETFRTRAKLSSIESALPEAFLRIHRSVIVNGDQIEQCEPHTHGRYCIHLVDGTRLVASKRQSKHLRGVLGRTAR